MGQELQEIHLLLLGSLLEETQSNVAEDKQTTELVVELNINSFHREDLCRLILESKLTFLTFKYGLIADVL